MLSAQGRRARQGGAGGKKGRGGQGVPGGARDPLCNCDVTVCKRGAATHITNLGIIIWNRYENHFLSPFFLDLVSLKVQSGKQSISDVE